MESKPPYIRVAYESWFKAKSMITCKSTQDTNEKRRVVTRLSIAAANKGKFDFDNRLTMQFSLTEMKRLQRYIKREGEFDLVFAHAPKDEQGKLIQEETKTLTAQWNPNNKGEECLWFKLTKGNENRGSYLLEDEALVLYDLLQIAINHSLQFDNHN